MARHSGCARSIGLQTLRADPDQIAHARIAGHLQYTLVENSVVVQWRDKIPHQRAIDFQAQHPFFAWLHVQLLQLAGQGDPAELVIRGINLVIRKRHGTGQDRVIRARRELRSNFLNS